MDGGLDIDRSTPSALNTCCGWVLFGKIGRSDVVDVAKYTLQQLVCTDASKTRRSYSAALTTDKNKDFRDLRRRKGCDSGHEECRTQPKGFGRLRISQGASNDGLRPGRRWRGTWETKGFRPAGCWRQNAIN